MTPRQTFILWMSLADLHQSLRSVGQSELPPAQDSQEPTPIPPSQPKPAGLHKIRGLGFESHAVMAPQPGEIEGNIFTVSRDIVQERTVVSIMALAERGGLRNYGVVDQESARDFIDKVWSINCKIFELICQAVKSDDESIIMDLCQRGSLNNFQIQQGDVEAAKAFFEKLKQDWTQRIGYE